MKTTTTAAATSTDTFEGALRSFYVTAASALGFALLLALLGNR